MRQVLLLILLFLLLLPLLGLGAPTTPRPQDLGVADKLVPRDGPTLILGKWGVLVLVNCKLCFFGLVVLVSYFWFFGCLGLVVCGSPNWYRTLYQCSVGGSVGFPLPQGDVGSGPGLQLVRNTNVLRLGEHESSQSQEGTTDLQPLQAIAVSPLVQ